MNHIEKQIILRTYRKFLKQAKQINWYNYREYSIRKIKHDFRSTNI
jgi:hypothetical protein